MFNAKNIFDNLPEFSDIYEMLQKMRDAEMLLGKRNEVRKVIIGYFEDMSLVQRQVS